MSARASLLAALLVCGCNSDALVIVQDLAMPDLAAAPKMSIHQSGTEGMDVVFGVATDGRGNVYVTGFTLGGLDGNQSAGAADAFLVKYDSNGKKVWTRQLGTLDNDYGHGVATDGMGNILMAGWTSGALDGNQNAGFADAFFVKYDTNGNKLWTRQFGTGADDLGDGVATDAIGNIYVAGQTHGALDGNQHAGGSDAFLVKYDTNGNRLWTRQFGTLSSHPGARVVTDGAGHIYLTGDTQGGLDGNQNAGKIDVFLVQYDANGNKLWTRQLGTPADEHFAGVASNGRGNIYMAGWTSGALDGNPNAGLSDAFLVKYDTNGNKLWTRQSGSADIDFAHDVATDGLGNVYVTGATSGGLDGNQNAGGSDAFVVKYDANGKEAWTRQFGTPAVDSGVGIVTDAAGGFYVAGDTYGAFAGYQNAGDRDAFLARFSAAP